MPDVHEIALGQKRWAQAQVDRYCDSRAVFEIADQ